VSAFDPVWRRIVEHERQFFRLHDGTWFTYRVEDDVLAPSHAEERIPRADFEAAYALLPVPGPAKLAKFVTGARFVHAILTDPRVLRGEG
jgi:hypothetical protein